MQEEEEIGEPQTMILWKVCMRNHTFGYGKLSIFLCINIQWACFREPWGVTRDQEKWWHY